jgi:hypothetical protein
MRAEAVEDALLPGDALLYVENVRSRVVLATCWGPDLSPPRITVATAGGREGVFVLVRAAREQGRTRVFGLVDRDFDIDARDGDHVFYTERHEIENHLLDVETLAVLHV